MCGWYRRKKRILGGTKSNEFLRKDRLLINTIVMFILHVFFTVTIIIFLLVFLGISNFPIDLVIG